MLIETIIYLYPSKEAQMDIEPKNKTWEKTLAAFELDDVVYAHIVIEEFNPGIPEPTLVTFRSGDSLIVQIPYKKFIDIWKTSKEING